MADNKAVLQTYGMDQKKKKVTERALFFHFRATFDITMPQYAKNIFDIMPLKSVYGLSRTIFEAMNQVKCADK